MTRPDDELVAAVLESAVRMRDYNLEHALRRHFDAMRLTPIRLPDGRLAVAFDDAEARAQ